ncbi:hypothetical protein K402DRAFT_389475 [Aulographum hederae CBS 113979]|uniref:Defective in cullin neddylation protein n=1 Tax=Aulographum hederae CBS 113979 TaxID=1176131 RepID=A0A6G1HE07_9PEZI|nr:hypothetical protein K402DRAFT_389475 [Aulographum hederae CBS 113979]
MPPASHTPAQRQMIGQFVAFTNSGRTAATQALRQSNWNLEQAVNGFYSSNASASNNTHKAALSKLFDKYRDDPKSADTISMDGMQKYMTDVGVSPEDVSFLILSELVQSPSMGEMERNGFVTGWSGAGMALLEQQQTFLQQTRSNLSKPQYRGQLRKIYKHTYTLLRPASARTLDLDVAIEMWRVLLSAPSIDWSTPSTPWLDYYVEFLTTNWKKAVNKDMWDQTFALVEKTLEDESLGWWNELESAWPAVVDEFITWVLEKRKGGGDAMEVE